MNKISFLKEKSSLYEPALDGLRLIAFLSVFFHHLPPFRSSPVLVKFTEYGWVGVELFFVISSYLFFRLLDAEYAKKGEIRTKNFYIRRVLRIYPLMICFTLAVMWYFSAFTPMGFLRLIGIATFTDNIMSWFLSYNSSIPATAHLWTLSFEFQIYLLIPFAFLSWKRLGKAQFLMLLALVYMLCFSARLFSTYLGAPHPVVWVTPFLQPEAILIGIVLATGALKSIPTLAWPLIFASAGWAFINTPVPWANVHSAALSYPLAAIACVALVESVRRIGMLRSIFSAKPMVFLGTISFGLYVYHILGIHIGQSILVRSVQPLDFTSEMDSYILLALVSVIVIIGMSVLSYYTFERPFLRLKDRFATVHGREIEARAAEPMVQGKSKTANG